MSKFRNRLVKRVMAVILSGAMVMSSMTLPNMTAYAAGMDNHTMGGYSGADFEEEEEAPDVEVEISDTETLKAEGAENENSKTEPSKEEQPEDKDSKAEPSSTEDPKDESSKTEPSSTESPKTETSSTEDPKTENSSVETSEAETSSAETSEAESSSVETSETGSSNEEETEVYSSRTIDLTKDLSSKKIYGDELVKISVLVDMQHGTGNETVDGVKYTDYVRSTANGTEPTPNKGKIPTSGAAFKITALEDATIGFIIGKASGKKGYFVEEGNPVSESECLDPDVETTRWHSFKLTKGKTYYLYVSGSRMSVYAIQWQEPAQRPEWSDVFTPEISDVALDDADESKINVTVKALIGEDGADKVTVYMYDADETDATESAASEANTEETYIDKKESVTEGEQTILKFSPKKSGNYTFKAVTSREGEETVYESALSKPFAFEYVKASWDWDAWQFLAYGNGVSKPEDNAILTIDKEAATVRLDVETGKIVPASNDGLAFYYTKIPSNKNFTFTANAYVDSWTFSNGQEGFGIMAADNIGPTGARIWNNSYQAVVSRISYKWNGVEISEDGTGDSIDMQIGIGSTEKVGVTQADIDAFNANEIGQPLRFKAEQKALDTTYAGFGTGKFNIVANYTNSSVTGSLGEGHVLFEDFWLQIKKDNTGYSVSYAPYKCEKDSKGNYVTDEKGRAKYILEDGKKVVDTDKITTQQYYDTDALSVLDPKNVYVGVFASRHAHIVFSDMELEERDPSEDPEPEQRKIKLINLSRSVLSGTLTNTPEYTFMFASNWKGQLYVKNGAGEYLSRHTLTDEEGNPILDKDGNEQTIDYYDVNGTLDPEVQYCQDGDDAKDTKVRIPIKDLCVGQNVFTVEYVPAKKGTWPEVEEAEAVSLKSYDTVRFTHTVEYRKYGDEGATIYVSPDGKAGNNGSQDSPLDIYTAVKYALPGQTLLLAGGRYSLNRTLEIPKTVSGRPAKTDEKGNPIQKEEDYKEYIKMIGDPDDDKRPVLDFNGLVAAVVAAGDFWYFKDFDVIRCKDGEKGIQVSGSYCVYDRVDTYRNGSTGLQICRASGTDTYSDWPKYNTILNCNSYLNVDSGYEDADGFAAKLTSGSGNVFDGCIAAFNADDGWDLFAKAQTGSIGGVIIRNSIAYRNGYVLKSAKDGSIKTPDEAKAEGVELICVKGDGNGNGFKMGGDGLRAGSEADEDYGKDKDSAIPNVGHRLYNSLAFGNKSKGIDSNSAPNIKAYNSISFNNDGANVSLSTYSDYVIHTDYELKNVISIRSKDQMAQSKVEADVQTFTDGYTTKYSLNMVKAASGSSTSACVFISLKNVQDRAAKVKVWWRSSDENKDCQIKILSEKDEVLAEGDYSKNGELKISELETSGTEKCYLGSTDGSINIYKVEVFATRTDKSEEQSWVADLGEKYSKTGVQSLNGNLKIYDNQLSKDGLGIQIQYAAIPTDGIDMLGQQTSGKMREKVENDTTYYYRSGKVAEGKSLNASGVGLTADDFESLDYPYLNTVSPENWRNEDGTIKIGDFLKLKEGAAGSYPAEDIPSLGGNPSMTEEKMRELIGDEVDGSISGGVEGEVSSEDFGEDYPDDGIDAVIPDPNYPNDLSKATPKYYGKVWAAPVKYLDYTSKEPIKYTGKKIEPEIHVYFSADPAALKKGKDYTIKYDSNSNVNAGEVTAHIIGANRFKGFTAEATFTINKIDISEPEKGGDIAIAIPSKVGVVSGGDATKEVKPTWQGKALKNGTDYEITTSDNKITVTGKGNFTGTREVTVETADADKLMSKASVKVLNKNLTYTGKEIKLTNEDVEIKMNGAKITTGFTLECANNVEIGKATLTVVGDGETYFGSKSITFNIKGGNLKDVAKVTYKSGAKKGQDFAVEAEVPYNGTTCAIAVNSFEVRLKDNPDIRLKKDVDYKVVQSGGNKAGNATLTIKGINNYTGALPSYKYKITPLDINSKEVEIIYDKTLDYMVGGAKYVAGQNLYIKVNGYIVDKSNYSLTYKNNKEVGGEQPTVTITGRKLLTGKLNEPLKFTINKTQLKDNPDISVSAKDVITNGKDLMVGDLAKANVALTQLINGKQKKLSNREFDKKEIVYYVDKDNDHELSEEEMKSPLNPTDSTQKKVKIDAFDTNGYLTIFVKVKAAEGSNYDGEIIGSFRAAKWSVAKAKITNLQPRIFGKNWKTASGLSTPITWSDTEVAKIAEYIKITCKLDSGDDTLECVDIIGAYTYDTSYFDKDGYAIVPDSYKKNDKVGTASFTIIGTGKYAGTKKVTFQIINKEKAEKTNLW